MSNKIFHTRLSGMNTFIHYPDFSQIYLVGYEISEEIIMIAQDVCDLGFGHAYFKQTTQNLALCLAEVPFVLLYLPTVKYITI